LYAICEGRVFEEATTVLAADLKGTLSGDGWAPYREFARSISQAEIGPSQTNRQEYV
jgi:hypothetical protein